MGSKELKRSLQLLIICSYFLYLLHVYKSSYVLSSEEIIADVCAPEILHSVRDVLQNLKFTTTKMDTLVYALSKTPNKVDIFCQYQHPSCN